MSDLNRIDNIKIGIIGDLALDIYWYADMKKSELSRETPHYPLPVVKEIMSLGAGGNVVANVAALKPDKLFVCGVCGDDWRGDILKKKLSEIGADTSGLFTQEGTFSYAYCKPMRMGISDVIYEDPRLDFTRTEKISDETENNILRWLDSVDGKLDILCVADQFENGIITDKVRQRICNMETKVIVDSRYRVGFYNLKNGILKPNEDECRYALNKLGIAIPHSDEELGKALCKATGADVLLTRGEKGSMYISSEGSPVITPALRIEGPIDICGAGDTSISAFASCIAAGATPKEAALVACHASGVTIQKIATTGTATREEITALHDKFAK